MWLRPYQGFFYAVRGSDNGTGRVFVPYWIGLTIGEAPVPEPQAGERLIRQSMCGVCGTGVSTDSMGTAIIEGNTIGIVP